MPCGAALIGLVDGDVQPGVADRVAGVLKAAGVAELGQDRDRRQRPDAVDLINQRAAAGLRARIARSARSTGPICTSIASIISSAIVSCSAPRRAASARRPFAVGERQQLAGVRNAVVIEHRVHPLLPLGALMHQRVPAPHPGAQIEQMRGRDP